MMWDKTYSEIINSNIVVLLQPCTLCDVAMQIPLHEIVHTPISVTLRLSVYHYNIVTNIFTQNK